MPEEAGDGLLGHILASVVAKITFAPKGMVEGNSAEDLLARADHLLEVTYIRYALLPYMTRSSLSKNMLRTAVHRMHMLDIFLFVERDWCQFAKA